ncbi:class I SAM-dependent methyltransferase [Synechococcus lacustris]|uniref:class I SAM-dependent methyltransferase n=1 Tax=Synechococcus lacustris TaxID=2116544 RepID=UPI0020CF8994|nr:class I SAM-dependent methyltransferase [Synechococcus lacustris]MCP9814985.1 class I SAM-dependent methyltransferase [Synechococcus lacustris L1E-Slac]
MNIPWKLKSIIFRLIDIFSANAVLYFLQKYVTKRSSITKIEVNQTWVSHQSILIENRCKGFIFEFGAGKNLAQNIYLSNIVDRQLVVDLNPMIDLQLVDHSRLLLSSKVHLRSNILIKSLGDLTSYGIEYRAPYDASTIDLPKNTLDACISTNTLEHIPKKTICSIFFELYRTLKDTGVVSVIIDYTDHYAHTDSSISRLNFLNFSESEWIRYNHNCHYQNRLRHNDFKLIFLNCGFQIISEDLFFGEEHIPNDLQKKFKDDDPSWCALSAHFVLKKRFVV